MTFFRLLPFLQQAQVVSLEWSRIEHFSFVIDFFFYYRLNCFRHWARETLHCCLSPILNELFSLLWFYGLRLLGQMKSMYLLAAGIMSRRAGSAFFYYYYLGCSFCHSWMLCFHLAQSVVKYRGRLWMNNICDELLLNVCSSREHRLWQRWNFKKCKTFSGSDTSTNVQLPCRRDCCLYILTLKSLIHKVLH